MQSTVIIEPLTSEMWLSCLRLRCATENGTVHKINDAIKKLESLIAVAPILIIKHSNE